VAVTSQREAVQLCPQLSAPSPSVWQNWTWVTTTCRIQEWSSCLLDWRVQTVNWKLSGRDLHAVLCQRRYSGTNSVYLKFFVSYVASLKVEMHQSDIWIGYRYRYRIKFEIGYRDNRPIHIGRYSKRSCPVQHSSKGLLPPLVVKKLVKLGPLAFTKLEKLLFCSDAFVMDV